jgi:hypothetical protein
MGQNRAKGIPVRVQIPAYTDAWMRGDRYGEVVKVTKGKTFPLTDGSRRDTAEPAVEREIAHVLLDKSGKILKFLLIDCTEV